MKARVTPPQRLWRNEESSGKVSPTPPSPQPSYIEDWPGTGSQKVMLRGEPSQHKAWDSIWGQVQHSETKTESPGGSKNRRLGQLEVKTLL